MKLAVAMKFSKLTAPLVGALLYLVQGTALADMSECLKMSNKDDKNFCMATYSGSGTYCDKIRMYERRMTCMQRVIAKQRNDR